MTNSIKVSVDTQKFGGTLKLIDSASATVAVMDYHREDACIALQPMRIVGKVTFEEAFHILIRKLYDTEDVTDKYLFTRIPFIDPATVHERASIYTNYGVRVEQHPERDAEADANRKRLQGETAKQKQQLHATRGIR